MLGLIELPLLSFIFQLVDAFWLLDACQWLLCPDVVYQMSVSLSSLSLGCQQLEWFILSVLPDVFSIFIGKDAFRVTKVFFLDPFKIHSVKKKLKKKRFTQLSEERSVTNVPISGKGQLWRS